MEENEDKIRRCLNSIPELRKAVLDELERFAHKGRDLLKRAKAVPKSRDLAAAMFAVNLAGSPRGRQGRVPDRDRGPRDRGAHGGRVRHRGRGRGRGRDEG